MRGNMPSVFDGVVRRHREPEFSKPVSGYAARFQRFEKWFIRNHIHRPRVHHRVRFRTCVATVIRIYCIANGGEMDVGPRIRVFH